jgi:hypothetical protein
MRSLDRGHTSCLPSEIFCDRSNYIAQIMSKYPDLFPEYLHSIESCVNSENTAARGQTSHVPLHSTIKHFPDARDRKLRITPYKKSCKIGHRDDEAVRFVSPGQRHSARPEKAAPHSRSWRHSTPTKTWLNTVRSRPQRIEGVHPHCIRGGLGNGDAAVIRAHVADIAEMERDGNGIEGIIESGVANAVVIGVKEGQAGDAAVSFGNE